MGIYLNPGNENYKRNIASGTYVDKTMMMEVLNDFISKGNNYICISRPRRFGKTIAQNMINAYYSKGCDSSDIFSNMKISEVDGYEDNLNRYNVIQIDLNSEYQGMTNKKLLLRRLTREIKKEMKKEFPEVDLEEDDSLAQSILRIYSETGETFVILIDEYDILVRENVDSELFDEYLGFLNSLFKSNTLRPAVTLAYMTGILPIVRDKVQSKLNNFEEYTMMDAAELAEFVGFNSDEVKKLCLDRGVDFEECQRWYDGYRQHGYEIYNPESVVKCVTRGFFGNYWGKTSSYETVSDRIRQNFAGTKDDVIRMISGEEVAVDADSYLNTMNDFTSKDDAFGYLVHIGYLAYDRENGTCRIPNKEVREEWFRALKKIPEEYSVTNDIIQSSKELLHATWNGDEKAVASALDTSHINVTSNRSYNNEDALQSAIYLAYIYALNEYTVVREMTAGKGFADVVYIPFKENIPAMIIELKRNSSTGSAIDQIREKRYSDSLPHYHGDLLLVGINYDEKEKVHQCRIEKLTL